MAEERTIDWTTEVARLVPNVMRHLFSPPSEQSPLWDLPVPQMRALFLLRCRGDRSMREVAESLGVAMSTATQLADRLDRLGLVERRTDAADRRVVRLALTEAGRAAMAEHARQRAERIAAAMERLTGEEQEAVLAGLQLLESAALKGDPEAGRRDRNPHWDMMTVALQPATTDMPREG